VWDFASHLPIGPPVTGHTKGVSALATADIDGVAFIVSGGEDATVRLWRPAGHGPLTRLRHCLRPGPPPPLHACGTFHCGDQVTGLAICPTSRRIAIASGTSLDIRSLDGPNARRIEPMARVLRIAFGDYPNVLVGTDRGVLALAVSADRRHRQRPARIGGR
jgi:WD40 repeat protein